MREERNGRDKNGKKILRYSNTHSISKEMKWRSSLIFFLFLSCHSFVLSLSMSLFRITHSFHSSSSNFLSHFSQNLTINYFLHNQSTSARINKRNVIAALSSLSLSLSPLSLSLRHSYPASLFFSIQNWILDRRVPLSFRSSPSVSPFLFLSMSIYQFYLRKLHSLFLFPSKYSSR